MLRLMTWVTSDEILHIHPTANSGTTEKNFVSIVVNDFVSFNFQNSNSHFVFK